MSSQSRSVMVRTMAYRALLEAAGQLRDVKDLADAVPPGRKQPTVPAAMRRHLDRALRIIEESRTKIEAVPITDTEKENARWGRPL